MSFPLLAVTLGLFAIGYTRLARDVPHAATFAALLTHGLGRTVGVAAGCRSADRPPDPRWRWWSSWRPGYWVSTHRHGLPATALSAPHGQVGPARSRSCSCSANHRDRVTVATRMFVDGPDVADLPATLTDRAREYSRALPDLVAYLADRVEPRGRDSAYLGRRRLEHRRRRRRPRPHALGRSGPSRRRHALTLHATRPELPPQARSTHTLAHLGPVWAQHTPAWATTPVAATARTDLADAHGALATMHRQLRRVEPAWSHA